MASLRNVRRLRDSKGTNLLEAAIITPLLLLLTFGIVDFSSMFYCYLALENGVSQATRFGITGTAVEGQTRQESIIEAMRRATPTLTIPEAAFTFRHMPPGGAAWVAGTGGPNAIENVEVRYTWQFMTPIIRPFFTDGRVTLRVSSTMKNEGRFD